MPAVSVIVPVYNVAPYLPRCLDSLVNQSLRDIEIICVDDGSTDESLAILSRYAIQDARIKVITKANGGLSSARNAGMEIAQADYIGFVDSDDWIEPRTYEVALNKMLEDHEIGFVNFGVNVVSEDSNMDYTNMINYFAIGMTGKQALTDELALKTYVTAWSKLWRCDIIAENKLTFPDGYLFEDNPFFWNYITNCKYAYYLEEHFYNYFQRKDSIIGNSFNKKYQTPFRLLCWEVIYKYYKQKNVLEEKRCLLETLFLSYYQDEMSTSPQIDETNKYAAGMVKKYELNVEIKKALDGYINYSFVERLFSVKNSFDKTHKIICIFGIKIKIRRKKVNHA